MIRMSLDKEASSASPTAVSLPQQRPLPKPCLFQPKNGLHQLGSTQPSPLSATTRPQTASKRRYSVGVGFKGLAKRRRRINSDSQSEPVLPSHFLLGGNIFDPLNLNSLLDEEVNRATNQETPKCSPLPSRSVDPVEILVPRDITDPLNLKGEGRDGTEGGILLSPLKARRRHRNRHHGGRSEGGERRAAPPAAGQTVPVLTTEGNASESPLPCELNTAITCRDDVVTPPILLRRHTHPPAPAAQRSSRQRRRHNTTSTRSEVTSARTAPTKFQTPLVGGARSSRCGVSQPASAQPPEKDQHRYQYGNHSCYYGYHGFYGDRWEGRVGVEEDPRLCVLEAHWFKDKKVLDIGCGAGHMVLSIARRFDPAHILGVELDEKLVQAAKQNIRHFLSHDLVVKERKREIKRLVGSSTFSCPSRKWGGGGLRGEEEEVMEVMKKEEEEEDFEKVLHSLSLSHLPFPLSFRVTRGPLSAPPLSLSPPSSSSRFPNNITFIQGDYVSEHEPWPGRGQYDVIMCLGVTKWVQLQSGDRGVVRLFRRAYHSLSPGGLFLLEPQQWSSYSSSKRASAETYRRYSTIRLTPERFTGYLMDAVGFASYRLVTHTGNQRLIYLFHKGPAQRK
ncbi:7SK snRNA methylphosphate capping enzyme-like [Antennarius striatus]|uniref:7SK snRNA methylphosphate capping enzyme-like n=1 Tax=Antennarius striatus TaxID=241820 RepID=UPI0035B4530C